MNSSDNKNHSHTWIGKWASEELLKPYEPSHEEGNDFASPESEFGINSLPEDRSAQTTKNCDIEVKTGEPASTNPIVESNQNFTGTDEPTGRVVHNVQTRPKQTVKTKNLRGGDPSCLRDVDFKWLKGEANSRAIFWFWAYIRNASNHKLKLLSSVLTLPPGWNSESKLLYSFFKLPLHTTSSAERSQLIICFFNKLSIFFSPYEVKESFEHIRNIWLVYNSPINKITWLKKNDSETIEWAWGYLFKADEIQGNILPWFKSADLNERYIAIMGAIDCWAIPEDENDDPCKKLLVDKKALLDKMESTFKQRKRRAGKGKVTLSPKSQKELDELAELHGVKINKLIEKLINNEHRQYKDNPEEYKTSLLNNKW